jgi:Glucodextranase, domain B/K319L-like, PKD domain
MRCWQVAIVVVGAPLLSACGSSAPECLFCFPEVPITFTVDAGPDQSVVPGDTVALAGSADHSRSSLVFQWSQIDGPAVEIRSAGFAHASFVAPFVEGTASLSFRFTARTVSTAFPVESKSDDMTVSVIGGSPADAPTAVILSPPNNATVNGSKITVTGEANDPDGIREIRVNGELASTNNGFLTWSANIPLEFGSNTITVSTTDTLLNTNLEAHVITVENLAVGLNTPTDIAVDEANARLLVLDSGRRALIEIDLSSGAQSIISDNSTPNDFTQFNGPERVVINAAGNIAWIIDRGYENLIVVNLENGLRSELIDTSSTGPGASITDARDIALDELSNRALLLVSELNGAVNDTRIVSVDLADGSRSILSDALTPNVDNPFGYAFDGMSIVFDDVGFRLLVMQAGELLSVDPLTGSRTIFSETGIGGAIDATKDNQSNRALIENRVNRTLYSADLNSGNVQSLWAIHHGGDPQRIAFDSLNNRTLILYKFSNEIYAIDMLNGQASIPY